METENQRLYNRLRLNYFTHSEAMKLSNPKVNQYSNEKQSVATEDYKYLINKAIRARRIWRNNLVTMGWNDTQIVKAITQLYKGQENATPFDFLRLEYLVAGKESPDYKKASDLRKATLAKARIRGWSKRVSDGVTYKSHRKPEFYQNRMVVRNVVNQENRLI